MENQNQSVASPVEIMETKQGRVIEFRPRSVDFKVFLDEETSDTAEMLNRIRQEAPPEIVILAVSLVRGLQVGINYSKKYAPHLTYEIEEQLTKLLSDACGKYLFSDICS